MLAKIKSTAKPLHVFAVVFCIIVLAWSGYPYFLLWLFSPDATLEKLGPFGDLYGGLNTLFSGMALLGLGVNIYMQGVQIKKLEAKEQQNEDLLKIQVDVMKDTAILNYFNETIAQMNEHKKEISLRLENQKIELETAIRRMAILKKSLDDAEITRRKMRPTKTHPIDHNAEANIERIRSDISNQKKPEIIEQEIQLTESSLRIYLGQLRSVQQKRREVLKRLNSSIDDA